MSAEGRTELLRVLAELSRIYPDWRFGQLVANIAGWAGIEVRDVDDEQLLRVKNIAPTCLASRPDRTMSKLRLIDNIDEFKSLLDRSGLLTLAQLSDLAVKFPEAYAAVSARNTATALCALLIDRGALTYWQCGKLRERKYKGFFLDQYKLLDYMWSDDESSHYMAKDMRSNKRVELAIHHPKKWFSTIEFHVSTEFD